MSINSWVQFHEMKEENLLSQALFYPPLIYSTLASNLTYRLFGLCFLPFALFALLLLLLHGSPLRSLVLLKLTSC